MKTQTIYSMIFVLFTICISNNLFAQASVSGVIVGHTFSSGYYCGWNASSNSQFDIKNEAAKPIYFYTNAGSGALNNMRMFIYDNSGSPSNAGFVGIGDFVSSATPQSLLHLDKNHDGDVFMQITNTVTGVSLRLSTSYKIS